MLRLHRKFTVQAALLWLTLSHAPALAAQAIDTTYNLHGIVIDGVTGKPIARALVTSLDRRLATMTNDAGRFSIDVRVPPQNNPPPARNTLVAVYAGMRTPLNLTASKPGYIAPEQPLNLPLDDTLSATDQVLKLMPGGGITGRVSADGAESLQGVQVMLISQQPQFQGVPRWAPSATVATRADGTFHFSGLQPGNYTVMTSEWRGDFPATVADPAQPRSTPPRYPPVFNGDATRIDSAIKFHVRYGSSNQVELHMHRVPYYTVTIPVANKPPQGNLGVRLKGESTLPTFHFGYNSRTGNVEGAVPDGQYTLLLTSMTDQQPAYAVATLNVQGAPVRTAPVTLAPGATITIRLHTQFNNPETDSGGLHSPVFAGAGRTTVPRSNPSVYVNLQAQDNTVAYSSARTPATRDDELTITGVAPGAYNVMVQALRGYAASMSAAGVDLLTRPLVIADSGGAPIIDLTLRDDFATLNGVLASGAPNVQTMALLLDPANTGRVNQYMFTPDGHFTARNLPPGTYRIAAFPMASVTQRSLRSDLNSYIEKHVTAVTVSAGQTLDVTVPLLSLGEIERASQEPDQP